MRSFMEDESCLVHYAKGSACRCKNGRWILFKCFVLVAPGGSFACRSARSRGSRGKTPYRSAFTCLYRLYPFRKGRRFSSRRSSFCRVEAKRLLFLPARKEKFSIEKHFVWPQTLTGDGRIVIIDMLCSSF